MKLCISGRAVDVQQMIAPMVAEKGEKLKITVCPGPIESDGTRRYHVEVEMKKMEKGSDLRCKSDYGERPMKTAK